MCPGEKFQGWTSLKVIFLLIFPFMCHSQTTLQISDSLSPVEATLGENVTIPCVLTDTRQPQRVLDLNLSTDSVRWDRKSLNGSIHTVYLFTQGINKLNIQRFNIEGKEFKRGIASLTVYNVQTSDEGEYICHVYVAGNKLTAVRTVEVSARPVVTLSSYNVTIELGNEKSVTCFVHKFYPESVKIRWEKRSASSERFALYRETSTRVLAEAEDGTFNVTSVMSVKPSSIHETGDKYSCIVSHRSLKSERAVHFILTVKEPPGSHNLLLAISVVSPLLLLVGIAVAVYFIHFQKRPPKISGIAGIDDLVHGESSTLSWTVSGFRPKNIEINASLERGDKKEKIRSWKYPLPPSQNSDAVDAEREEFRLLERQNTIQPFIAKSSSYSYSCLCSTNITPDKKKDKEARLVLEVIHSALKSSLTKRYTLNFKGAQPVVEEIISKHVGQQMELSCRIHSFHPRTIDIKWFKEDEELPTTDCELCAGEDNLYSTTSVLMYTPELEDMGKIFRCKVNHQSLQNPETREWKLEEETRPFLEQIISKHVGQQMELSCRIHSFHPKTIDIKWFKEREELPMIKCEPSKGKDGLYSTTSIVMYTPELEDVGKTFRCKVDHQSLQNPETSEWKLEEQSIKR